MPDEHVGHFSHGIIDHLAARDLGVHSQKSASDAAGEGLAEMSMDNAA